MVEKSNDSPPVVAGLKVRKVVEKGKQRSFEVKRRGGKRAAVKVDPNAPRQVMPAGKVIFVRGLRTSAVGNSVVRKGIVVAMAPDDAAEAIRAGVAEFVKAEDVAKGIAEIRKTAEEKAAKKGKQEGKMVVSVPGGGKILSPEEAQAAWDQLKIGMPPADYLAKEPKGKFAKAAKIAIEAMA